MNVFQTWDHQNHYPNVGRRFQILIHITFFGWKPKTGADSCACGLLPEAFTLNWNCDTFGLAWLEWGEGTKGGIHMDKGQTQQQKGWDESWWSVNFKYRSFWIFRSFRKTMPWYMADSMLGKKAKRTVLVKHLAVYVWERYPDQHVSESWVFLQSMRHPTDFSGKNILDKLFLPGSVIMLLCKHIWTVDWLHGILSLCSILELEE